MGRGKRQAELKMGMRGLNSDIKKRLRKERKRGNVDVRGRSPVDCNSVNQAVRGLGQEDKKE